MLTHGSSVLVGRISSQTCEDRLAEFVKTNFKDFDWDDMHIPEVDEDDDQEAPWFAILF